MIQVIEAVPHVPENEQPRNVEPEINIQDQIIEQAVQDLEAERNDLDIIDIIEIGDDDVQQ